MAMLKAPLTPRDHRRGDPDAPVVLVEYGDYQCSYCAAAEPVVTSLLQVFGHDIQLVFRHFPLAQMHPLAETTAEAAEFADGHGAFWATHEALFANQPRLSLPVIFAIAGALNLSQSGLREALEAGTYARRVRQDFTGGVRSGVDGTPCFFVNGERHDGGHSFEALSAAILAARAAAVGPKPDRPLHAG
ncbi:DsbA family protein [Phenylobacterium sp.]|uniref:DsbA family protein n=1 Tax=Phenylobacterium sp. TaxID=1871053 RepID=UPI002E33F4CC|nr:thioredoxin domain-containing protein [Phenylobacterium sp.]HEX4710268.1 thioredoxin domain-containing protein [Phenylobacterium sp.]